MQKINLTKLNIEITLKIVSKYKNLPFYLPTNADWRGRIYTSSFFLSYQGSDFSNALIQF
jgi:DNA-directed RNA polymerase